MSRRRLRVRGAKRRGLVVGLVVLAALVFLRHVALRGDADPLERESSRSKATASGPPSVDLPRGERTRLLALARARLASGAEYREATSSGAHVALVSLYRPQATALVARGLGSSNDEAIISAVDDLVRRSTVERRAGVLKIDLLIGTGPERHFDEDGRADLDPTEEGLWLVDDDLLLLPEELTSRRLIKDGDLQSGRLRRYLAEGPRSDIAPEGNPGRVGAAYRTARFDSFVEGDDGLPARLYRGNDRAPSVAPRSLLESARLGGDYLVRHQRPDGNFDYEVDPTKDRLLDGYNLLRHAGSCYALFELHRATGDPRYLEAGRRGVEALLRHARGPRDDDSDADFEAIVSPGEEAKLGGAALAILAMVEHQRVSGDARWLGRSGRLARFLLDQQRENGSFASKYFYGAPDPKPFVSIYYPGEAILALSRLHRLDGDSRWLEAARRGADYLIDGRDAGKATADLPHDHWLLMALAELDDLVGDPRYAAHGARIAEAILGAQRTASDRLDWIGTFYDPPRSTPTATRAEALVAMHHLALRTGRETRPYVGALMRMAAFQRRCQLAVDNALYLPRPDRALGGFRRSLTRWEIRIDYVQHNVSALLGLREILLQEAEAASG